MFETDNERSLAIVVVVLAALVIALVGISGHFYVSRNAQRTHFEQHIACMQHASDAHCIQHFSPTDD